MSPGAPRPVALVTGASSGIGLELARMAAARGHDVVLVARGEAALRALAEELARDHGASAHVVAADLALPDGPERVVEGVEALGLEVDVLVNNAGFGLYGDFLDTDLAIERDMIAVNVTAPTALAKRFAIPMARRGRGRILNVASTAAFQPGPRMAVYYATKAYVVSFSEALADELSGSGLRISCLAPGPTATAFAAEAGATESRLFQGETMSVDEVARIGYEGWKQGKPLVIAGARNRLGALAVRLLPRAYVRKLVRDLNTRGD